jgi:hypothetical protein
MKPVDPLQPADAALPVSADSLQEFHAARLLLLLRYAGQGKGRIESLTKMAKLDFFVRYPKFLHVATKRTGALPVSSTESPMIRFHYGPWDKRYYDVLAYLKARGLISVDKNGRSISIALTDEGEDAASKLSFRSAYSDLISLIKEVKDTFGDWSGSRLKNFIYETFDEEVSQLRRGQKIR